MSAKRTAEPPDSETTIAALNADPANRRQHGDRNLDMIASALRSVGAARSIVIDETNEILAGNGVIAAAPAAGITKVRIVEADGDTIVAVRRRGLTLDQKRDLAMYDNRTAELAEWNAEQLEADMEAGLDLRPFWTEEEEAALRAHVSAAEVQRMAAAPTGDEGRHVPARDEGYQTFSCPLTLAQERTVREALREARRIFQVTTTPEALAAALAAWLAWSRTQ